MTKYETLKEQIEFEAKCLIDNINSRYRTEYGEIPYDVTLTKFIGDYTWIESYDRGSLFAYLSIKSTIDMIEGK